MSVVTKGAPARALAPVSETPAEDPRKRRVADVIVDTLIELGVDTFYGIPGGAISPMYDALLDNPRARVVHTRHETSALFIAAGHALSGGSVPCVLVTSGPGVTNAITGLASAFADGVPIIVFGGEVPRRNFGRGALQEGSKHELDTIGMVRSVTKYARDIVNPRSAANDVRKAVATARSGRQGPVFLSLPLDVANERVLPTTTSSHVGTSFQMDDELLARAAEMLQSSRRGLILVGSGARHPMAVAQIRILAEMLQIPVATTPKGKGLFPESSPLSLGVFGYGGHPSAARYVADDLDVLLAVGCGLGETATNNWNPVLQPSSIFIQIDIDSAQIGKNYQVDLGLVGPAHIVLTGLVSKVRTRPRGVAPPGIEYHLPDLVTTDTIPLHPARVVRLLQDHLPADTIYTSDIGEHLMFVLHYLQSDHPDGFLGHLGLGSMGSGIGSAIGAKVARPGRPVVSICGDYGFQMYGMELATCVQYGIGVVFAIFNDGSMRMVENGFQRVFGRPLDSDGPAIDFAAVARAHGAHGVTIRKPADFEALTEELLRGSTPTVLDIRVDKRASFSMSGRDEQLGNFTGRS